MPKQFADIPNGHTPFKRILTGGQPSRENLEQAHKAGCNTVINLRPSGEFDDFDEQATVEELGMRYVHIPVAGAQDINAENGRRLDEALQRAQENPVMVHCGSGNRVGALFSTRARYVQDKPIEEALRIGSNAGLEAKSPLYSATEKALHG